MPFVSRRPPLTLDDDTRQRLVTLSNARTAPLVHIQRAGMILAYADGEAISAIARRFETDRPKVERCIDKALQLGALAALDDLRRAGRPPRITPEARAWVVSLACEKPQTHGYSYELWTLQLLATHIRDHCQEAGHPSLSNVARGTVWKLLEEGDVHPHRIEYYLERRDPDFEAKMAQVLLVYQIVAMLQEQGQDAGEMVAYLSYDEKPGVQAIENLAPELPPVPGEHTCIARDHQYRRHGTVTLMAGIDLVTGRVYGTTNDRHRSREFIAFLEMLDGQYPPQTKLRIILDNHSAHTSKETRAYLATKPNRFEFIFTPTHGSWLNVIESFFAKMAKTMLRGIRVSSKEELKQRIHQFLDEVNKTPVVFRWRYGLDLVATEATR